VPLPTKRRIYCVLRSPHVNKDSREHFEMRTHKRLIDIHSPSDSVLESLRNLDISSGVDVEIKALS
jgi:small subunit ribosomal protein S10